MSNDNDAMEKPLTLKMFLHMWKLRCIPEVEGLIRSIQSEREPKQDDVPTPPTLLSKTYDAAKATSDLMMAVERDLTINKLREVCEKFGDNDWSDDTPIFDIMNDHLFNHLKNNGKTEEKTEERDVKIWEDEVSIIV